MSFAKPKNLIDDWVVQPVKKVTEGAGSATGKVVADVLAPVTDSANALLSNPTLSGIANDLLDRKEGGVSGSNPTIITAPASAPATPASSDNLPLLIAVVAALGAMIFLLTKRK